MSRGAFVGVLSLLVVVALVYYFMRDQSVPVGGGGEIAPLETARVIKCAANQRALESAIAAYRLSHQGENPYVLHDLVPGYVRTLAQCPAGGAYLYNSTAGTVSCPNRHESTAY